jgi:hypothetical protein
MRWHDAKLALLSAACLGATACNNDNISNRGFIGAGRRFTLVVEPGQTAAESHRFLLDTATGDLWTLAADASGHTQWMHVAEAPPDAKALSLRELLGGTLPRRRAAERAR